MAIFKSLATFLSTFLRLFCPVCYRLVFSETHEKVFLKFILGFVSGFILGQIYHVYLLKKIPFPYHIEIILALSICLFLGLGNGISTQFRCVSLLMFTMYFGKVGRGVLKAVVLTYVVAGPIANMGMNAKEVVRVFACSTELSNNLSREKYNLLSKPFRNAAFESKYEIENAKETLRYFSEVMDPIHREFEMHTEAPNANVSKNRDIQIDYLNKIKERCKTQKSQALAKCYEVYSSAFEQCQESMPMYAAWTICWPLQLSNICGAEEVPNDCDDDIRIDSGLGNGYAYLNKAERYLTQNDAVMQHRIYYVTELEDIQDAKETGERVLHAFEEKSDAMLSFYVLINVCMALLFLRIFVAAKVYHDKYLTVIEHDNFYVTDYFKCIDQKRKRKNKLSLLPLKKMERSKYVDVHSTRFMPWEKHRLVAQVLKVLLEVVTATTFVMLDRLFYEALDVVKQHAQVPVQSQGAHDMEVEVEGSGPVAQLLSRVLGGYTSGSRGVRSSERCLPQPQWMRATFFLHIYGGYSWILLLLALNSYTVRLPRLICSYFYPRREKQRVLHLYNDILKKRMKMQTTLRKKAVQAVRAHYLASENLLSLRMRFPSMLHWLKVLPCARMRCLICGETEPRNIQRCDGWQSCPGRCPFSYCAECWCEVRARCLACDSSLLQHSDDASLSDEDKPPY